jgi:hypothetical protein
VVIPSITNALVAAFLAVTFVFGYWLVRLGRPYSGVLLTVHKLASLAALVVLGMILIRARRDGMLDPRTVAAGALAGLSFILAIISGGLMTALSPAPAAALAAHRVAPLVALILTALVLYRM